MSNPRSIGKSIMLGIPPIRRLYERLLAANVNCQILGRHLADLTAENTGLRHDVAECSAKNNGFGKALVCPRAENTSVSDELDRRIAEGRVAQAERCLTTTPNPDTEHELLTGDMAPPRVLRSQKRLYVAYRPDSDAVFHAHPEMQVLSDKWVADHLANNAGDLPRLYSLALNIKQTLTDGAAGDFAELGVFRGDSAAVLAHYARSHKRTVFLFDTFDGFEARDIVGIDANKGQGFADTSLGWVRQKVGTDSVVFVKGYFPGTVTGEIAARHFAVVHLDCDLYAPIKAGLEFFYPRLSTGGLLIIHDYSGVFWDGVKRAVDEFMIGIPESLILIPDKSGTAMLRRAR